MSIPFTTFGFKATGGTTNRTMPDRLAEVKNVVDFGADPTGDNATATTAAIQAAVDAAVADGGGVIDFPGYFTMNGTVTINHNGDIVIKFRGTAGSSINGNFDGYLFERMNVDSGSPIYTGGDFIFEKLGIGNPNTGSSAGAVRLGSTRSAAFYDCAIGAQVCVTSEDSAGNSSKNFLFENCKFTGPNAAPYTANGIIIGGVATLLGCDFIGLDVAVRAYGSGFCANGCRAENCNTGFKFGIDSTDITDQGASGFFLQSSTEGDTIGVHLAGTCSGGVVSGQFQGHAQDNNGYPRGGGVDSAYGILIDGDCSNILFLGCHANNVATAVNISIPTASSRANLVFRSTQSDTWDLPTNAYTAIFEDCNVNPVWTFSQLPSGSDVIEGDEFNISDSNTATWGATVAGSGSNRVLVRYNNTNWTVVGK